MVVELSNRVPDGNRSMHRCFLTKICGDGPGLRPNASWGFIRSRRLPQPSLLHDIEGNITAVAGSPTQRFRDRVRLPCLAPLALILTRKFVPCQFWTVPLGSLVAQETNLPSPENRPVF